MFFFSLAYNLVLITAAIVFLPVILIALALVPKFRAGFWTKLGLYKIDIDHAKDTIFFHAVSVGEVYEQYLPMDVYPMHLLKACLAGDIDKMENLGIYEVTEEDFALCEFVDPSKIEIQQIIRDGINLMIKEA